MSTEKYQILVYFCYLTDQKKVWEQTKERLLLTPRTKVVSPVLKTGTGVVVSGDYLNIVVVPSGLLVHSSLCHPSIGVPWD